MTTPFRNLKAIVFDWAGTMVDHGSRAPAIVFQEIFRRRGIPITAEQAREPMGRAKRDHIAAITSMPEVSEAWRARFGAACGDTEIDAMYADFLPLQKETLQNHGELIDGAAQLADWCRSRGLKIGSSTGYTRELMQVVTAAAERQGYVPDCVLCAEDAPRGRPAPYLLFEAAQQLDVFPMWHIVKVDDTPVGIEAGRNAGCWTVGITRTGNGVGLSVEELAALTTAEVQDRCAAAATKLTAAGAHFIAETVADLRPILDEIDSRLSRGTLPVT